MNAIASTLHHFGNGFLPFAFSSLNREDASFSVTKDGIAPDYGIVVIREISPWFLTFVSSLIFIVNIIFFMLNNIFDLF